MRVCIDAGHGMGNRESGRYDPGAVYDGIEEASIALQFALDLKERLEADGHMIVLTRDDAITDCSLYRRGRQGAGCDAFVSIHLNASANPQANGVEVFYGRTPSLARVVQDSLVAASGLCDRGTKFGELRVIGDSPAPAILIELGFLSNANDRELLTDRDKMFELAEAVSIGLVKWFDRQSS